MDDLLVHGLQDIYYAEPQILKSLPKSTRHASAEELGHDEIVRFLTTNLKKAANSKFKYGGASQRHPTLPSMIGINRSGVAISRSR